MENILANPNDQSTNLVAHEREEFLSEYLTLMGVYDKKGSLEKGKDADILILDKKLRIRSAWSKGQMLE